MQLLVSSLYFALVFIVQKEIIIIVLLKCVEIKIFNTVVLFYRF